MTTCGVVVVSFLFRTAFVTISVSGIAFFHKSLESNATPHSRCDDTIQLSANLVSCMSEVSFGVTLVSQPVTLLVGNLRFGE
jgi:hypothetical protein